MSEGVNEHRYGKSYCNNPFVNSADRAYVNQKIDQEVELFTPNQFSDAIEYRPKITTLVQSESRTFNIKVLPEIGANEIVLDWILLSNGYKKTGRITIKVEPLIEKSEKTVYVDTEEELKPETTLLEYKIIEK